MASDKKREVTSLEGRVAGTKKTKREKRKKSGTPSATLGETTKQTRSKATGPLFKNIKPISTEKGGLRHIQKKKNGEEKTRKSKHGGRHHAFCRGHRWPGERGL